MRRQYFDQRAGHEIVGNAAAGAINGPMKAAAEGQMRYMNSGISIDVVAGAGAPRPMGLISIAA